MAAVWHSLKHLAGMLGRLQGWARGEPARSAPTDAQSRAAQSSGVPEQYAVGHRALQVRVEILRVGALLLALALGLAWSGWMQRLDHLVFDLGQRLQPAAVPHGVVIVAIDQRSLDRIGAWPWPRATDARLVDAVCRAGAAAVGLDLALTEPGRDAAGNAALTQALRACGRVALPVVLDTARNGGQIVEDLPIPQLASAAAGLGRVGVQLDSDGVARSVYLWEGVGAPVWPLLAQTLLNIAGQPVRGSTAPPAAGALPAHPYALIARDRRLLRYAGPRGTVPSLSADAVLQGAIPPAALRNRIVLIGATAAGLGDFLATPVTTQGAPMPGVEVLANTLLALRDGSLIRALPDGWALALTALLALVPLLWLPRLMPLTGLLASVGWVLALLLAAAALPLLLGWWWPPSAALAAAVAAYPLWGWRRLEAARRYLDAQLHQLRQAGRDGPASDAGDPGRRLGFEGRILAVQAAQQRLSELQARRDEALAFISHDVRAPLAAAVQRLQAGALDPAARQRLLAQLQRAHDLAQGFLDLTRAQALEPAALTELDLGAVLHQAADLAYEHAVAAGVRIVRQLPDTPIWVRGDFGALERLVGNLLRNAVQHSPRGSSVTLTATLSAGAVCVSVQDQGAGLTPEQTARLFERFARGQATQNPGSTGLGLYFVRLVAQKHGGTVGVDSTPGAGARFWVELPRMD
ncbi:MAG: CHASE2 domain-containing protein [Thiomonas sp.]